MEKENPKGVKQIKLDPSFYYHNENGLVVLTEAYHLNRGYCCGFKCKHCPYDPIHIPGNTLTKKTN
jgi:hypothetical protein